jgi:stearoyl-CoA desaturase (delta-9 desaturase)
MKLTHDKGVRLLQLVNHLIAIPALVWLVVESQWHWLIGVFGVYWGVGILGIHIGFHRFLSHRSFETYRPIEYLMMFCGVVMTMGSPMAWTIAHRIHHANTDTDLDPHSPQQIGVFRAWFGLWNTKGFRQAPRMIRGMNRDPLYRWTHKYYFHIIALWILVLAIIHPLAPVFLYCVPAAMSFHAGNGIVVIPHLHGYRNHDLSHKGDTSRNSWIAHLLTMGEGWHNNHHAHPTRWNTQERWWEFDPPAWIIRLIKK